MMRAAGLVMIVAACGSSDPAKTDAKMPDTKLGDARASDAGFDAALCAAKPPDMVSWWRGENDATDSDGSNPGTMVGGTYAPGRVGSTFLLSGSGEYVTVPDANTLDFTTQMTVEAWINQAVVLDARIVDKITPGGQDGYYFDVIGGKLRFGVGPGAALSPSALNPTTWYQLTGTYDSTAIKIFINGTQVATVAQTSAIPVNALALSIGSSSTHGNLFNGSIDEVAVYNRALTDSEIQALYAAGGHGRCP